MYSAKFGAHSLRPQFQVRGNSIYVHPGNYSAIGAAGSHGSSVAQPWFRVRGNKIYNTIHNPSGKSMLPQYEIKNGQVYTTVHHPEGRSFRPVYKMR